MGEKKRSGTCVGRRDVAGSYRVTIQYGEKPLVDCMTAVIRRLLVRSVQQEHQPDPGKEMQGGNGGVQGT